MNELNLDPEEKELMASYEADEWLPVGDVEAEKQTYSEYARATFKKDKRVNIRISGKDLEALQTRAIEEGIPYQTLIASILHKFVNGRLIDRPSSMNYQVLRENDK
jgi:predicted DNA binding CopG/RHH family protein